MFKTMQKGKKLQGRKDFLPREPHLSGGRRSWPGKQAAAPAPPGPRRGQARLPPCGSYSFLVGTRQMFWAYSRMERSAAKMPDLAMFTRAIWFHRLGSR